MAGSYRHQAFIEAPIDEVWPLVSDPRTHPEWWPDVIAVEAGTDLQQGAEYKHTSNAIPLVDAVESVWVVERMEQLKEAHFRCTLTGSYARFSLTPAQGDTFVEIETGMDPTALRWRLLRTMSGSYYRGWVVEVLDALRERCRGEVIQGDLQGM
jgi:uncharacterized protein YndB with AHSA1/START domain